MKPNVSPIPRRHDVGGGAIPAIYAMLRSLGARVSYEEVQVMSGAAFTFVYDNAPVFEPLRDLHPLDSLTLAAQSAGFAAHWVTDQSSEAALGHVAAAVADGRPAILPIYSYSIEAIHQYGVAIDCDAEGRRVTIQMEDVREIALPEVWWGSVTGPTAWAACPVFVAERRPPLGWTAEGRLHRALRRATALLAGGHVAYRECAGTMEYSRIPLAGRQARYGLPAYDLLAADLGGAESLGDFALIWRLDAQLSQLQQVRAAAAAYLRTVPHRLAQEAGACCSAIADCAADLKARFWYRPTREMASAADVMAEAASGSALVHWVGLGGAELACLSDRLAVTKTPWGPVAIIDTIPRRREAVALVARLRSAEEQLGRLLAQLGEAL